MVAWGLKTERLEIDGIDLTVRELSAAESSELWDLIAEGEATGNMLRAFRAIVKVAAAAATDGAPLFPTDADLDQAPIRVIAKLADKILEMSEIGVKSGNSSGGLAEDSPTS